MKKILNCVMLIDDNPDDNFVHRRVILKNKFAIKVIDMESAIDALKFLKKRGRPIEDHPDLIFLDINMPDMNGWEFLEEYNKLDDDLKANLVVIMLTTSQNPKDEKKARSIGMLADFQTKPLSKEIMEGILEQYF